MKKILLSTALLSAIAGSAFAGTKYNPEVSGVRDCEMVKVMSDLNPGQVLYTYRVDPTCGNVRTGKDFTITIVKGVPVKTVINEENNGG